jgi:hypothetical protein
VREDIYTQKGQEVYDAKSRIEISDYSY